MDFSTDHARNRKMNVHLQVSLDSAHCEENGETDCYAFSERQILLAVMAYMTLYVYVLTPAFDGTPEKEYPLNDFLSRLFRLLT